jgi:purine-binding chemotaxis protein CheW
MASRNRVADTRSWVLFELADTVCALPAATVLNVLEPQSTTRVPFAPASVIGLIADAGGVMPLVDPKTLLFDDDRPAGADAEPAVLRCRFGASIVALAVDRLLQLADVDHHAIVTDAADAKVSVVGTWSWQGRTVLLLEPDVLDLDQLNPVLPAAGGGWVGAAVAPGGDQRQGQGEAAIIVGIGKERYALPVASVGEIVVAGGVTPVPKAPPSVAGIGVLRTEAILLLRLDRLLQREGGVPAAYIVIDHAAGSRYGLLVDRVIGLQRYRGKSQHAVMEQRLGFDGYYLEADGTVTPAIDLARLVDAQVIDTYGGSSAIKRQNTRVDTRQFLSFTVAGEMFALPIDAVDRVLEWQPPTPLPGGALSAMTGAIELQGEVVPVADIYRRLGVAAGTDEAGAYLVVRSPRGHTAFSVERVHRIVTVPVTAIEAVGGGSDAVVEIGRLDDRLFWILSAERLAA